MEPSSLELVETALAAGARDWKHAGLALESRPPDAACARAIIAAHRAGRCDAWLAAWLLGVNGHAEGYDAVLAILRSGSGLSSESYAGVALVKIRGDAALPDLVAVLEEAQHSRRVHEGAAFGLGHIRDPRVLDALLLAVDRGRVRRSIGGSVAHEHGVTPTQLLAWLRDEDRNRRELAAWSVLHWSANVVADGPIPDDICRVLLALIDAGRSPFDSAQCAFMRERLSR